MLREASLRSIAAADFIGAKGIVVQAADTSAKRFFERFGFVPISEIEPLILCLPIEKVRYAMTAGHHKFNIETDED